MAKATISEKNTMMSFVIPKDLKARLTEVAEKENRSFSNVIVSAIQEYISNHNDIEDIPVIEQFVITDDNILLLLNQTLTEQENNIKRIREYCNELLNNEIFSKDT